MEDLPQSLLQISYDVMLSLAHAASEKEILKAIEVYLQPQGPQWIGLFYLDVLAEAQTLVLVASQHYPHSDSDLIPIEEQRFFVVHSLSGFFQSPETNYMLIEDTATDRRIVDNPRLRDILQQHHIGSFAIIPLYWADQLHGVITLCWGQTRSFTDAEKQLYQAIAKPAAVVASGRRNFLIAEQLRQQSENITKIYTQVSQTKGAHQIYESLSDLVDRFGAETKLLVRANQFGELYLVDNPDPAVGKTLSPAEMNISKLTQGITRNLIWVENVEGSSLPLSDFLHGMGVQSYVCMSFYIADRWVGSFIAGWHSLHHFDAELQTALETILPTATTVLANQNLLERLQNRTQFADTYLNTIFQYAPVGIHSLDIDGNVTYCNGRVLTDLGETPQNMLGKSWKEVFTESRESLEAIQRRAGEGHEFSEVLSLRGRQVWYQYAPLRDVDGTLIGSVGITQDITQYVEAQAKLRSLSQQLIEVEEKERHNLARELHDEIGQLLTSILYQLNKLERLSPGLDKATLTQIESVVTKLIAQLRELSLSLHPPVLDEQGLEEALRWYCSHFTSQTQIHVDLKISGSHQRLKREIELTCYRVVQEALNNIARYAQTDSAIVRLSISTRRIKISVQDKGIGFDVGQTLPSRATYGLAAMRERLAMLNGKLSIESKPSGGTVLSAEIPLNPI